MFSPVPHHPPTPGPESPTSPKGRGGRAFHLHRSAGEVGLSGPGGGRSCKTRQRSSSRQGQALVEFALIALVLYMLLAGILTFGHMLYVAQGLQSAADLAAREISRTPLPAMINNSGETRSYRFDDAMQSKEVRTRIFDEAYLVIDLDDFYKNFETPNGEEPNVFRHLIPLMPLVNQQLTTMMIVERPDFDGDGIPDAWLLRYPGALLRRNTPILPPDDNDYGSWVETNYTVGIPLVSTRTADGFETISWERVVEEVGDNNAFGIDSVHQGVVALRINYPFQSASMSSFRPNPDGPFEPTIGLVNEANDEAVAEENAAPGDPLDTPLISNPENGPRIYAGTYGGNYGLGAQGAFGKTVRPYRRIITGQAIYRREIFSD